MNLYRIAGPGDVISHDAVGVTDGQCFSKNAEGQQYDRSIHGTVLEPVNGPWLAEWFRPGTLVKLRSGGPLLTVMGLVPGSGEVAAKWFDGTLLKDALFPRESLMAVIPPTKPELLASL